jgi:hypothetical protein
LKNGAEVRGFRRFRPRIGSGYNQGILAEPSKVDSIKEEMLTGRYEYEESRGRIGGWRDADGSYWVADGHHRINAALEIYWETGERSHVDRLLQFGAWKESSPPQRGRLPTRSLWSRVLYYIGRVGL